MEELKREFKGVWIDKDIWLDKRINALDKIILTEISSLDVDEEGCYASNEYLAEFCQCTVTKISTAISKLIELGYLEIIKFDGRKRYIKCKGRLLKSLNQPLKNLKADFKNFKENNISNNTNNNIDKYIIEYLNQKAKTKYKPTTNKTRTLINARIKEGFTKEDFIKVIDNKVHDWLNTDMEKYLRPETLFGTKFESYLNQRNNLPSWFNQNIEKEDTSDIEDIFKEFR